MARKYAVGKSSDLGDHEMKVVEVGGTSILLYRIDNKFYATSPTCPHYGAPLEDGIISGGRVICPWHQSAFDIRTGDLLEPPACDALEHYEVEVTGGSISVYLPEEPSDRRMPEMSKRDETKDKRQFVIVGAGAAGYSAAQTLREDGFCGRIVMVTSEEDLPYDRPNLSKDYLQGDAQEEWMPLRPPEFYERYGIEVWFRRTVKGVDSESKIIEFEDGDKLPYDKLLLTLGGYPRRLDIPGSNLKNIFTLRSFDDTRSIIRSLENSRRAVIIGGGFIGMETAFSLRKRGLEVVVVLQEAVPFARVFGTEIGNLFRAKQEAAGVEFMTGRTVKEFKGEGAVNEVVLDNDEILPAHLVIVGVGVNPATDRIQGVKFGDDDGVVVDDFLSSEVHIFAAGDVARVPDWRTNGNMRIEHWRTALQQGRIAAHNMMDMKIEYRSVPFFWTMQAGLHFRYVGYVKDWDEIITVGRVPDATFLSYFVKGNKILAAAGVGRDKQMAAIAELMRQNRMPSPDEIRRNMPDMVALVQQEATTATDANSLVR